MNHFFVSKRRAMELAVMILLDGLFFLLWDSFDFVMLFSLGFIWNWVASQESSITLNNTRRYRFSTLKTVFNLQNLFLKPFASMPSFVRLIVRALPAGIFWSAVIIFNDSNMPWWGVFIGSLTLELVQLETKMFQTKEPML